MVVRERERKRLREHERLVKKKELRAMIKEIQEEVQAKVSVQVAAIVHTFLGDVGVLLRHLLKGGKTSEQNNERTMETARALQILHQFDLEESESDTDTDSESDSEQRVSSDEGNTKGTGRDRGMNNQNQNTCQCGKAVRQYQSGR